MARYRFEAYVSEQREQLVATGEQNDCSVRAVAAACGVEYSIAHQLLADHGRKKGKGFPFLAFMAGRTQLFGHDLSSVTLGYVMGSRRYMRPTLASVHAVCRSGRYIAVIRNHAFAIVNGAIVDTFTVGARSRVIALWRVE